MNKPGMFVFLIFFIMTPFLLHSETANTVTASAAVPKISKQANEFYNKGKDNESMGKYKEALREYAVVLKTDKDYYPVYKNIGNCFFAIDEHKKALYYYKIYLEHNKADKTVLRYTEMLDAAIKTGNTVSYPDFVIPYEIKSPSTALLFSHLNFLPPLMPYMGYGTLYSQSRGQGRIFPTPAVLSFVGIGIMSFSLGLTYFVTGREQANDSIFCSGALCFPIGYFVDLFSAPVFATDNSLKFLEYIKQTPLPLKDKKQEYKDPALATTLSLLFPGAGYFYAEDFWGGFRSILISSALTGIGSSIAWATSKPENLIDKILLWGGIFYAAGKLIDIYSCSLYIDKVNEEYYKQMLCPNSPYRLKETKEEKDTGLGLLLSFIPVPGLGNLYAEDYSAALVDVAYTAAGLGIFFGIKTSVNERGDIIYDNTFWLKCTGLVIASWVYISNLLSVPNKIEIWNAVYAGKKNEGILKEKVDLMPVFIKDGFGLQLTYNFK